jgi:hypothetical protein
MPSRKTSLAFAKQKKIFLFEAICKALPLTISHSACSFLSLFDGGEKLSKKKICAERERIGPIDRLDSHKKL